MKFSELSAAKRAWCVSDLGELVWWETRQECNDEHPTQTNLFVQAVGPYLIVSNDSQTVSAMVRVLPTTEIDEFVHKFNDFYNEIFMLVP